MDLLETKYVPLVRMQMIKERFLPFGEESICTPQKVIKMVGRLLEGADKEYTIVISVDSRNKPVAVEVVSIGTLNAALIEGREIFKHAILSNSAGIILLHNHPSGNAEPSREDILVTRKMKQAGDLLGISLLDHIIVGDAEQYVSMAEEKSITD